MSACIRCGRDYSPRRRGLCHNCYEHARNLDSWSTSYIDAQPVREHVLAILAAGVSARQVAAFSHVSRKTIHNLLYGRTDRDAPPNRHIRPDTAQAIMAVPIPESPEDMAAGGALVPSIGPMRRLQALVALGYPQFILAKRIGMSPENSTDLFYGGNGRVTARTARRVEKLYDELSMKPSPSDAARRRAAARSWAPPLAWDDDTIDDVEAQPDYGRKKRLTLREFYEDAHALGLSDEVIAKRRGIRLSSLKRRLFDERRTI